MDPNTHDLFSWFDYILFSLMLGISVAIGIYFGFFQKKQNSADEYLMGGKQMQAIPIAVSLIACQISTTTLLAVPADVYRFGANYVWLALGTVIECVISYYVYLPVFFNLQLTSIYEYVELRFDRRLRLLTSFFNVFQCIIYCSTVVHIPSLAFSQVTGVDVHLIAFITSAVCIFYTTVGGLKAVVWTDTLQFCVMTITFVIIFLIGVSTAGGFGFIWSKAVEGHRLNVTDFDPTIRDGFGALVIGGAISWLTYTGIYQGVVQKVMAVPSYKKVAIIMPLYVIGICFFHIFATLNGLLLYSRYWDCDPLTTHEVDHAEQLLPHFVMNVAGQYSGLPGVFIAGVYSAGLSSLSANLNTLAANVYEDFVAPFVPKTTTQERVSNILKLIVLAGGVVSVLLILIFEKLGGLLDLYTGLTAVTLGPSLGIFTLGMLVPKANSKGAFCGALAGAVVVAWIAIQNLKYQSVIFEEIAKPISIDGCNATYVEGSELSGREGDSPFVLYRISFWLYSTIGLVLTMVVGVVVSCFTKHDKAPFPLNVFSPVIHGFLKDSKFVERTDAQECDVQIALMEKQ